MAELEMSSFLWDMIFGVPAGAWGQWCYHFHASQPFYGGVHCFRLISFVCCLIFLVEGATAGKESFQQPKSSQLIGIPLRHFYPRANILSQGFGHQDFSFYIIILGTLQTVFCDTPYLLDLFGAAWS